MVLFGINSFLIEFAIKMKIQSEIRTDTEMIDPETSWRMIPGDVILGSRVKCQNNFARYIVM
jgi:hypothetical protein